MEDSADITDYLREGREGREGEFLQDSVEFESRETWMRLFPAL